jgi:pilus assembly protein Flp/PilA
MRKSLYIFLADRRGATAMEYALIAAFVAIAIVAGATSIGTNLTPIFAKLNGNF